jgi:hypothetical protein
MWRQIKAASISAVLLGATAGIASAQGYVTQDPGTLTPGNLTFQDLGPAGPVPGPTGTGPTGTRETTQFPGGYGSTAPPGTATELGTGPAGFGPGNNAGVGGNITGSGR